MPDFSTITPGAPPQVMKTSGSVWAGQAGVLELQREILLNNNAVTAANAASAALVAAAVPLNGALAAAQVAFKAGQIDLAALKNVEVNVLENARQQNVTNAQITSLTNQQTVLAASLVTALAAFAAAQFNFEQTGM